MRWSERQVVMLREMGVRLWAPQPDPMGDELLERQPLPDELGDDIPLPPAEREASAAPAALGSSVAAPAAQPAVLGDVARMDWDELREAVASCTACKLCSGRTQTVFGVGHPQAHWMIVGEAPGEQEDRQG
ncbi:MAG TPA: uracil-DNA glycosylase, partial [Burkholderiaceae bacterium]